MDFIWGSQCFLTRFQWSFFPTLLFFVAPIGVCSDWTITKFLVLSLDTLWPDALKDITGVLLAQTMLSIDILSQLAGNLWVTSVQKAVLVFQDNMQVVCHESQSTSLMISENYWHIYPCLTMSLWAYCASWMALESGVLSLLLFCRILWSILCS